MKYQPYKLGVKEKRRYTYTIFYLMEMPLLDSYKSGAEYSFLGTRFINS